MFWYVITDSRIYLFFISTYYLVLMSRNLKNTVS